MQICLILLLSFYEMNFICDLCVGGFGWHYNNIKDLKGFSTEASIWTRLKWSNWDLEKTENIFLGADENFRSKYYDWINLVEAKPWLTARKWNYVRGWDFCGPRKRAFITHKFQLLIPPTPFHVNRFSSMWLWIDELNTTATSLIIYTIFNIQTI